MAKKSQRSSVPKNHFSGGQNKHEKFENEIIVALSNMENCRVFKREVGMGFRADGAPFHYGFKGETDLQGILRLPSGIGQFLAIEVKTGAGRLTVEQERYKQFVLRLGGRYIEARWDYEKEFLVDALHRVLERVKEE